MDEFGLIDTIKQTFSAGFNSGIAVEPGTRGIGDDCAIIPQHEGWETLISTDMLVEGSHFLIDKVDPYQLGWKSAAVNFSDIAAMGGEPVGSFLAFALPASVRGRWIDEFIKGYKDISLKYGFPLLGGDTTSSPDRLSICVTVAGKAEKGSSKLRSAARPGDLICVTGPLGDSAGGLKMLLQGSTVGTEEEYLLKKHFLPEPRMDEGRLLRQIGAVHAMMDISDGIGSDIRHIMEESGVGAEIDTAAIPCSDQLKAACERYGLDILDLSICGGEDYELLFTVEPEAEAALTAVHHVIGRITEGDALSWKGSDKDFYGFKHF